jgi:hypothetical protein
MATPIEEPEELAGADVYDQMGEQLGSVKRLYGAGGEGAPSWVGIDVFTGMIGRQLVLVPLARLKQEDGQVRVPYTKQHLMDAPDLDAEDGLSEKDEERLNDYYAVARGDQPAEDNPDSYSSQMPDADGPPEPLSQAD